MGPSMMLAVAGLVLLQLAGKQGARGAEGERERERVRSDGVHHCLAGARERAAARVGSARGGGGGGGGAVAGGEGCC